MGYFLFTRGISLKAGRRGVGQRRRAAASLTRAAARGGSGIEASRRPFSMRLGGFQLRPPLVRGSWSHEPHHVRRRLAQKKSRLWPCPEDPSRTVSNNATLCSFMRGNCYVAWALRGTPSLGLLMNQKSVMEKCFSVGHGVCLLSGTRWDVSGTTWQRSQRHTRAAAAACRAAGSSSSSRGVAPARRKRPRRRACCITACSGTSLRRGAWRTLNETRRHVF
jgi:hypothetical protein